MRTGHRWSQAISCQRVSCCTDQGKHCPEFSLPGCGWMYHKISCSVLTFLYLGLLKKGFINHFLCDLYPYICMWQKTTYLRKVTSGIIVSMSLKSYGLVVQLPLMRYFPDCLHPELRQPSNPLQLEPCTQPKWSLTGPLRAQQSAGSPKSPLTFYCHNSLQNLQQQALW